REPPASGVAGRPAASCPDDPSSESAAPSAPGTATSFVPPSAEPPCRLLKSAPPRPPTRVAPRNITPAVRKESIRFRLRARGVRSEEHTSELQSLTNLVCRLLLEKK